MKQFKVYNTIFGWLAFAIAAVTYLLTIEPTASFWDCGEFIASAYKLEVGHPPGAPFFIMTARLFSLMASDPSHVAMMVNAMSAILSALTILFLFWTITHLSRKLVFKDPENITTAQKIIVLASGMIGALVYTFSDTFWFSAVEGEVYAYSSFFTAIVFWAILRWDDVWDQPHAERWLILISYLMGLSIGVHLLNLLAIPAIVLVYYFRKHTVTWKNTLIALGTSGVILVAILYGMIPGFVKVASWFELFFVNVVGLSFNSGVFIYLLATAASLVWALYETQTEKSALRIKISFILALVMLGMPFIGSGIILGLIIIAAVVAFIFTTKRISNYWLNTIVLCMTVMLVGYSSYAMTMIRSAANAPMDQNSPDDVFALQYYLNREQYGDRPLFYGAVYSAPEKLEVKGNTCVPVEIKGAAMWAKKEKSSPTEKDQYIITGYKMKGYEMDSRFKMLFPRMYSSQQSHVNAYKEWGNVSGQKLAFDRCGETITITKPTFGENLRFFFTYQLNYMYIRYFMWNFSGRQNDMQGYGEIDKGNWITGISFIDNLLYGDQDALPDSYKTNKGHNAYYMLPFILGVLGMMWQLGKGKKGSQNFWITFTLFFMTGIAIVLYLNQTPFQPRERDYAYAGSFYAFSIWIGLGTLAIYDFLKRFTPKKLAAVLAFLIALPVPVLMASENWDDHDRSGRYTARDFGANYLNTCPQNAIIFSNGDNDTFPLWYNQEVEGTRTDMRVCNLSYLQTDWYIDQMKRDAYESKALPINWERKDYMQGNLEVSRVFDHPTFGGKMELKDALELVRHPELIQEGVGNILASTVTIPVNKEQVLATKTISASRENQIVDEIPIKLRRTVNKSEMMVLEMLSSNNWERPIYFAVTVGEEFYPNIKEYLELEGLAYRFVPIKSGTGREGINTDAMYDNMMNKFKYGGVNTPGIYLEETNLRMCRTFRMMFAQLVEGLINEGKTDKAMKALDFCLEQFPAYNIPHDYTSTLLADYYYKLGNIKAGDEIMDNVGTDCLQKISFTLQLKGGKMNKVSRDMNLQYNLQILNNIAISCDEAGSPLAAKYTQAFETFYQQFAR